MDLCSIAGATGWLIALVLLHRFWLLRNLVDVSERIDALERVCDAIVSIDDTKYTSKPGDEAVRDIQRIFTRAIRKG